MKTENNFNFLRLFFAWLVIVSHSFELLDGNRAREPLTSVFGTLSFGELAVNAFFVLSGYLISASWLNTPDPVRFMSRRVARIVPGFLVCVSLCVISYALLVDRNYVGSIWFGGLFKSLLVLRVELPAAFPGSFHAGINGSLWTIHFEFVCYLAVLVFGVIGLINNRRMMVFLWAALIVIYMSVVAFVDLEWTNKHVYVVKWLRLSGCYLSGVVWLLYGRKIADVSSKYFFIIVPLFFLLLYNPVSAVIATTVLFPSVLSMLAYAKIVPRGFWLKEDISYGVYLYAWPVQKFLILYFAITEAPWVLVFMSTVISAMFGWFSWRLVERPSMQLARFVSVRKAK